VSAEEPALFVLEHEGADHRLPDRQPTQTCRGHERSLLHVDRVELLVPGVHDPALDLVALRQQPSRVVYEPDGDAVTAEPELRALVDPAIWDHDVEESTESLDVVALGADVPASTMTPWARLKGTRRSSR